MTTTAAVRAKVRSVTFTQDDVRVFIGGGRVQARIVVKPQPTPSRNKAGVWLRSTGRSTWTTNERKRETFNVKTDARIGTEEYILPLTDWLMEKPWAKVGDIFSVRETWMQTEDQYGGTHIAFKADDTETLVGWSEDKGDHLLYTPVPAEWGPPDDDKDPRHYLDDSVSWRSPRTMPPWASRMTAVVDDVGVEKFDGVLMWVVSFSVTEGGTHV